MTVIGDCSMLSSGRWRPIAPLSGGPRIGACSAVMENEDGQPEMWVIGGNAAYGCPLATVEAYNPRTNTWRSCLPLSQPRYGAVAGVVGGRLVVAGGYDNGGGGRLTSVEAYSPSGWTPLPPMPHAVYLATACVMNGRLHVMGGLTAGNKLQVLEMSEENEFSWNVKAELPFHCYLAASGIVRGKLWLMGGAAYHAEDDDAEATASVLVFDTASDTWAAETPLSCPMMNCCAAVCDGELYLKHGLETHVHRNGAWVRIDDAIIDGPDVEQSTCQPVLLG